MEERHQTVLPTQSTVQDIARGRWNASQQSTEPAFRPGFRRYGAAKLFLVMMVHELQRRLDRANPPTKTNVCVVGVDPGRMSTGLARQAPWFIRVLIMRVLFPLLALLWPRGNVRRPATSAAHVLEAALGGGGKRPGGGWYFNGLAPWETSAEARNPVKRDWVWKESVRCARLEEGETALVDWR